MRKHLAFLVLGLILCEGSIGLARCIEFDMQPPSFCATISKAGGADLEKNEGKCLVQVNVSEISTTVPVFATFPLTLARLKSQVVVRVKAEVAECQTIDSGKTIRGVLIKECNDNQSDYSWLPSGIKRLLGIDHQLADYSFGLTSSLPLGPHKGVKVICSDEQNPVDH